MISLESTSEARSLRNYEENFKDKFREFWEIQHASAPTDRGRFSVTAAVKFEQTDTRATVVNYDGVIGIAEFQIRISRGTG